MSWTIEFDDPILLPNGKPLATLRDAANHVMALPKHESAAPLAARGRMPNGRRREARARHDGVDRGREGADVRRAGGAASAATDGGEEVQDHQLTEIGLVCCEGI